MYMRRSADDGDRERDNEKNPEQLSHEPHPWKWNVSTPFHIRRAASMTSCDNTLDRYCRVPVGQVDMDEVVESLETATATRMFTFTQASEVAPDAPKQPCRTHGKGRLEASRPTEQGGHRRIVGVVVGPDIRGHTEVADLLHPEQLPPGGLARFAVPFQLIGAQQLLLLCA